MLRLISRLPLTRSTFTLRPLTRSFAQNTNSAGTAPVGADTNPPSAYPSTLPAYAKGMFAPPGEKPEEHSIWTPQVTPFHSRQELISRISTVFTALFTPAKVKGGLDFHDQAVLNRPFNSFGIDSLDQVEFLVQIEREFSVEIDGTQTSSGAAVAAVRFVRAAA